MMIFSEKRPQINPRWLNKRQAFVFFGNAESKIQKQRIEVRGGRNVARCFTVQRIIAPQRQRPMAELPRVGHLWHLRGRSFGPCFRAHKS